MCGVCRIDPHLLTRWDKLEKLTSSALFTDVDVRVLLVCTCLRIIFLNGTIYIVQAILHCSKLEMLNFVTIFLESFSLGSHTWLEVINWRN